MINKTHRQIFCHNEKIGHLYVPNLNARVINENGGYYVKTNSQGFRSDVEFQKNRTKKSRILFFGDSNTASDGVSNCERFSELIGNYFDADIYNYGVSGTGTDQQYLTYQEYAKNISADLVIIGVLVENIERNKVAYRETIQQFTANHILTPKPYYKLINGKLKLFNVPVPRAVPREKQRLKNIKSDMVQWAIPERQKLLYKIINRFRKTNFLNYFSLKYKSIFQRLRSLLIRLAYQPHSDYGHPRSDGYLITESILKRFISEVKPTPVIIFPIPTFHYYADGANPIYKNFFSNFNDPKNKVYVFDILDYFKKLSFKNRQALCFKNDKAHFSKYGHKIITEYLTKKIKEKEILPLNDNTIKEKETVQTNKTGNYILGISAFYHDSAAALIRDGEIIAAAQEERFSRIKNDRRFPISAINYCLERGNIQQNDLTAIVYYDNAFITLERILYTLAQNAPSTINGWIINLPSWVRYKLYIPQLIRKKIKYKGEILHNYHHRSHCAAAFYPSPFTKAAILTVDGVGEWATASIALGDGNKIKMLKEIKFPDSLGLLYSAFTQFIGFKVNSGEYKMMGLAPYGKPIYKDTILNKIVHVKSDGSIQINQLYFNYLNGSVMTNNKFAELFGGPARVPESRITQREMDIASSIQRVTEFIILKMALYVKEITQAEYLCMSGGVALNCVANGYLEKQNIFKDIWIQPAAGDAGSSLGCALDAYYTYFQQPRKNKTDEKLSQYVSYLGPSWNMDEIIAYLKTNGINYRVIEKRNRDKTIANLIKDGKVIGHFSGRAEFGPRSLGARSILGDARNQEMQTTLNLKIKYRESFRPFAPTVLAENVDDYFVTNKKSPYMLFVYPVRHNRRLQFNRGETEDMLEILRQHRSDLPAITHIDYSARVQTIELDDHKEYYELIKAFQNLTGYGIIVNTSFNIRGEPIVNSPMDAYQCFMKTEMDVLLLENCMLLKEEQNKLKKQKHTVTKQKQERSNDKYKKLQNDLAKIYRNKFVKLSKELTKFKVLDIEQSTNWSDCDEQNDPIKIFKIPIELEQDNVDPNLLAEKIINYWYDSSMGEIVKPVIRDLIELKEKYPLEDEQRAHVSGEMYEMF